jgi:hypothetical protein
MSSEQPLHEHDDTHLWKRTFAELVARSIEPTDERLLIIADSEAEATRLESSIKQNRHTALREHLTYSGDQENLPYDPNSMDVVVHLNPKRNPFKYHQPLYQATEVARPNGTIIYKAAQRLAHSKKAEVDTIYSLNWESSSDPSLVALMTVTEDSQAEPSQQNQPTQQAASTTTLDAFQ